MPKRRQLVRRRRDELSLLQRLDLLAGPLGHFASEVAAREAWFEHRDEILASERGRTDRPIWAQEWFDRQVESARPAPCQFRLAADEIDDECRACIARTRASYASYTCAKTGTVFPEDPRVLFSREKSGLT